MMTRRILLRSGALLLSGALMALQGCDIFHHNQVRSDSNASPTDSKTTDEPIVREDPDKEYKDQPVGTKVSKGFFSNSRLPGAMSSEGRDIERSLGIP